MIFYCTYENTVEAMQSHILFGTANYQKPVTVEERASFDVDMTQNRC
jgi:hypothetical protein